MSKGNKNSNLTKSQHNHKSNQNNANKSTPGVNSAYAKVHGNRGKQLNPNNK